MALLLGTGNRSWATAFKRTWIERHGEIFTLHVKISGRPQWLLEPQPNRLQIDLLNVKSSLPPDQFLQAPIGPLGTIRISPAPGQRMRIQIDVTGKCDYVVGRKRNELIVSLAPAGISQDLAYAFSSPHPPAVRMTRPHSPPVEPPRSASRDAVAAPAIAAARKPRVQPDATAPERPAPAMAVYMERPGQNRPMVVVDPGHGGLDPGTRSADGLLEKDLALQIARRVAGALTQRGVDAVLTRDRDEYLTLAQRTAIANQSSAELFVSIHLNWSPNPQTMGMEVYYLNNTTDRATIRLARMENAAGDGSAPLDPSLNYILSDLRQQYKATESALLAQVMEQQAVSGLQAEFGGEIRGLGAKRGPFYVLVGPRIPAVLVECGFLSNSIEAQRLATAAYQQALAEGLATSVVHYLNQDVTAGTL
ncbi:MAG: N-acetylmuramoyl-L-alanine amidase [Candidatus Binataceae bacterium]